MGFQWDFFASKVCWIRIKFLAGHSAHVAGRCATQWYIGKRGNGKTHPFVFPNNMGKMGLISLLPILETAKLNFPVLTYDGTTQVRGHFWKLRTCYCSISISVLASALWTLCSRRYVYSFFSNDILKGLE